MYGCMRIALHIFSSTKNDNRVEFLALQVVNKPPRTGSAHNKRDSASNITSSPIPQFRHPEEVRTVYHTLTISHIESHRDIEPIKDD